MRLAYRVLLCAPIIALCLPATAQVQIWGNYPAIPRFESDVPTSDRHEVSQIDPLRGLQRLDDPQVRLWLKKQNVLSSQLLERISGKDELLLRIRDLKNAELKQSIKQNLIKNDLGNVSENSSASLASGSPLSSPRLLAKAKAQRIEFATNDYLFYAIVGSDQRARLIMRQTGVGNERVLYLSGVGEEIRQILPAPDVKKIAIVLAAAEAGTKIQIISVPDGEVFKDAINKIPDIDPVDFSLLWTANNNSLLYSRGVQTNSLKKLEIWQHHIDRPDKFDDVVISADSKNATSKRLKLISNDRPVLMKLNGTPLVLLTIASQSVEAKSYFYVSQTDVKGADTPWKNFVSSSDKILSLSQEGGQLFLLSTKKAPAGEILKCDLSASTAQLQLNQCKEFVKSGKMLIKEIATIKNNLYWSADMDGSSKLFKLDLLTNVREELTLPVVGKLTQLRADTNAELISFTIIPPNATPGVYSLTPRGKVDVLLASLPLKTEESEKERNRLSTDNQETMQNDVANLILKKTLLIPVIHGETISVNVSYSKSFEQDAQHPVLLRVAEPGVSPDVSILPAWIEQNGMVVDMNLHNSATSKPDKRSDGAGDIVAVVRYLMKERYASPKTLAAEELATANTTLISAVLQQPELFAAVSVRNVASESDSATLPQLKERKSTKNFPYDNLRAGVAYPAVFLVADANRPLTPMWMSAKLAAGLQILSTNKNKPVLLQTTTQSAAEIDNAAQTAERWAFFLWQIGEKKFSIQTPMKALN